MDPAWINEILRVDGHYRGERSWIFHLGIIPDGYPVQLIGYQMEVEFLAKLHVRLEDVF